MSVVVGNNEPHALEQHEELSKMLESTKQVSNSFISIPELEKDIAAWDQVFQDFDKETLFRFFSKHQSVFIHGLPWWHRFFRPISEESLRCDLDYAELQLFIDYFRDSNEMLMYGKSWEFCFWS